MNANPISPMENPEIAQNLKGFFMILVRKDDNLSGGPRCFLKLGFYPPIDLLKSTDCD